MRASKDSYMNGAILLGISMILFGITFGNYQSLGVNGSSLFFAIAGLYLIAALVVFFFKLPRK